MKLKKLNRRGAIETVEKITKMFSGKMVEMYVRPSLDRPISDSHMFLAPMFKARKNGRVVEVIVPGGWREPDGTPNSRCRTITVDEVGFDPDDQAFRIVGNGGMYLDLEAHGPAAPRQIANTSDRLKKDPELLAEIIVSMGRFANSEGFESVGEK